MWDAICFDTFATSNIHHAVWEAREVAEEAEKRKESKYQALTHIILLQFQWRRLVLVFLRLSPFFMISRVALYPPRKTPSLYPNYSNKSVAIQRCNATAVLGSSPMPHFDSFDYS